MGSPTEPRDYHGRWTGGNSAGHAGSVPNQHGVPAAVAQHASHAQEIARLTKGIADATAKHGQNAFIHYGHVGDLAGVKATLQDIHDRLHHQGEYHPSNRASVSK